MGETVDRAKHRMVRSQSPMGADYCAVCRDDIWPCKPSLAAENAALRGVVQDVHAEGVDLAKIRQTWEEQGSINHPSWMFTALGRALDEAETLAAENAMLRELSMQILETFHLNSQHARLDGYVLLGECKAPLCTNYRRKIGTLAANPQAAPAPAEVGYR